MKMKTFFNTFIGLALLHAPLSAEAKETEEHIPVGERSISHAEYVKMIEEKLTKMKEANDETVSEEIGDREDSKIVKKIRKSTYTTTHEGAFHYPVSVSYLGDSIQLEDGSMWAVSLSDTYKTLNWLTSDIIIIVPNHDIFSSYYYRLININTGANVKVNLYLGPIYNGAYTHWITAIDYLNREIYLEDGSIWKMSPFDQPIISQWLPNDTVIIGINDGAFSYSNQNILINVNMNNYSLGNCIY